MGFRGLRLQEGLGFQAFFCLRGLGVEGLGLIGFRGLGLQEGLGFKPCFCCMKTPA